jgi:hypothetical protein
MPGGDGTGPAGMGPMTGRAAGYCAGFQMPGYVNPMPGRGWGMGRGWGRGRGWGGGRGWGYGYYPMGIPGAAPAYGVPPYYGAPSNEQEAQALRTQAEHLEGALDEIRKRITELEAAQQKDG